MNTNRLNAGQGFGFDKNGNVTSNVDPITSLNRTFLFNGDNKQYEVKDANGTTTARYYYDGEGKRVKKKNEITDETTIFVYSSGKLVAEYSTVTPPANPTVKYTTTDHLGSPRVITDAIGQVTSRRDFLPFGEEVTINVGARSTALKYGTSDDKVRQKFTGYQKDTETSLDFAEARMYDNRFGRFTAIDPLLASGKSANPQTFNRYIYVGNSPIVLRDPTGLIGDYYTRSGHYIGSDKKDDGKYYYAEIDYLETRAEGPDLIHVKNTEEFFLESRTSTSQNSGEREAIRAFGGGFEGSIGDIQSGSWTGLWNIPSTAWNAAVTSTLLPFALPNASIKTDGFGLPSLYVPIPFLAKGYEYDNARRAKWGQQITAAAFFGPGAAAAPFAGSATSLSLVSRPNGKFYSVAFETTLASDLYPGRTRGAHFKAANTALNSAMKTDSNLAQNMSRLGISIPESNAGTILGRSPNKWTWHHDTVPGRMQLVPRAQHTSPSMFQNSLHPGGYGGWAIWGRKQ